eukprot:TRINITY_DN5577_c0_g1_i1.p1 TRINITY_DN5577_c0_g1~~TRINITY_DN5577_c0_g1_i1.p1  ORF type:complete len:243 (-),score=34.49 TRINITY_DN5577_c0_g1_i1:708-1436(-)
MSSKQSVCYDLSQTAYVKLLLHCLKNPYGAVNGVLLGVAPDRPVTPALTDQDASHREDGEGNSGSAGGTANVVIEDAIPLFHSGLGLAPLLEIALAQIEEHCQRSRSSGKHKGLSIVGLYYANELHDDQELGPIARKIADHIAKSCPMACALLVDNEVLTEAVKHSVSQPAVQLYSCDSSRTWRKSRQSSGGVLATEVRLREVMAPQLLVDYVAEERYREVVDFEDHLDDLRKDWLNPDLFK